MIELIEKRLSEESNFFIKDKPYYFKNLIPDVQEYITWNDINHCLNNPALYEIELINSLGEKVNIPSNRKPWVQHRHVQEKSFLFEKINNGCSSIILDYAFYNKKTNDLLKLIENRFSVNCSAHVYFGLENSKSFNIHSDNPPNFIFQMSGVTKWKVFEDRLSSLYMTGNCQLNEKDLTLSFEVDLHPGDCIYIPARCYHGALPEGKRISISVPCWPRLPTDNENFKTDRNWYYLDHLRT
jgi:ribosomal protein L16 Arg81 hydroxylase